MGHECEQEHKFKSFKIIKEGIIIVNCNEWRKEEKQEGR